MLRDEFPCRLHEYGSRWTTEEYGTLMWKVYSNVFVKVMKEMRSAGTSDI